METIPIQPPKAPVILQKLQGHYKQLGSKTQVVDPLSNKGSKTNQKQSFTSQSEPNSLNKQNLTGCQNQGIHIFQEKINNNTKSHSSVADLEPIIQKKVKANDYFMIRKNSSCFSTTTNDTALPSLSPQSTYIIENDDKVFDSDEFFLNGFDDDQNQTEEERQKIIGQINSIINKNNATINIQSLEKQISPETTFTCVCFLRHTWETNLKQLQAGHWCENCVQLQKKAQIFAQSNEGILLNPVYSQELEFQCKKKHQWSLSHKNYFKCKWCAQCRKLLKEEFKQIFKENEAKTQKEYEKKQEEMYNEAKRKSQSENMNGDFQKSSPEQSQHFVNHAKNIEAELIKIAEKRAQEYLQSNKTSENQFAQIKEVYKIILFPNVDLSLYFNNLSEEQLKNEYRSTAKLIHPDKCVHPQAGQAFQKLNHFHGIAVKRFTAKP